MKKKICSIFMVGVFLLSAITTIFATGTINKDIDAASLKLTIDNFVLSNGVDIVIEPDSWNFGALPQGATDSKRFLIKNTGTEGVYCNIYLDTMWDDFWMIGGGQAWLNPYSGEAILTVYFSPQQAPGTTLYCYLKVDWWYDGIKFTKEASIQGTSKTRDRSISEIRYLPIIKSLLKSDLFLKFRSEKQLAKLVEKKSNSKSDDWHYLPAYSNYAPNGMPDFSQLQQDDWRDWKGRVNLCGAVSLADVFWWLDSKHENVSGYPGDGNDSYPLVSNYNAPGEPAPGPNSDDHNYNNVNDALSPWKRFRKTGELIEQIAWYSNRQKDLIRFELLGPFRGLFNALKLYYCIKIWLFNCHLQNSYTVKPIFKPSFQTIVNYINNDSAVILGLLGYNLSAKPSFPTWGHFVAVAGINPLGYIALSDPVQDIVNPSTDNYTHNDASIVSHDIYQVNLTSPYPFFGAWCLPDFIKGAVVNGAIVISEKT